MRTFFRPTLLITMVTLTASGCSWQIYRGGEATDAPIAPSPKPEPEAGEAPPPATETAGRPQSPVQSGTPVPSLQAVTAPPSAGKAAAPATSTEAGKSRVEQVKEIMAAKKQIERQYEARERGANPNTFYRYKVESAETARLVDDGLHDPTLDLGQLQQPIEAFKGLPPEMFGNTVNWVKALREHKIAPRADQLGKVKQFVMDMNIRMPVAGTMNDVVFPHKVHSEWLACRDCHTAIFQMKRGGNPITMEKIVKGEYCGVCHGKVAFPIANCNRCHSAKKKASVVKK